MINMVIQNEYGIDFYKYLKCPDCKDVGLYCEPHRKEVEKILYKSRKK